MAYQKTRTSGWDHRIVNAFGAEVGTQARIGPCQVLSGLRVRNIVLAIHELDELVALGLGLGAEVAVGDEPLAHLRLGPAFPCSILGREVVVLDELLKLLALNLGIRLDDVVRNL